MYALDEWVPMMRGRLCPGFAWLLSCCLAVPDPAWAQTGAWPIAILEPPGAGLERPVLADVALSDGVAVLAYAGSATRGYRVVLATRADDAWLPGELLAEGDGADGPTVAVAVDAGRVAVGLPAAAAGGRIDIHRNDAGVWTVEQSIPAPAGMTSFGRSLSLRGDLLVASAVSPSGGGGLESYRRDAGTGQWQPAGFSVAGTVSATGYFAHTDGQRIAACFETACRTFVDDGNGDWSVEASVAGGQTPLALSGDWLFVHLSDGNLRIHRRVGAEWQPRQSIAGVDAFAVNGASVLVRSRSSGRASVHAPGAEDVWSEIASVDVPLDAVPGGTAIAFEQGLALVGSQSLRAGDDGWMTAGTVGLADVSGARFGAALAVANHRLWIGSPGLTGTDMRSGAVWVQALPGATQLSVGPVAPGPPALLRGFGAALSRDILDDMAVASRVQSTTAPQEARVALYGYWQSVIGPPGAGNELVLPLAPGRIMELDVAYDWDAFALTWRLWANGQWRSEVYVYSNRSQGFVPTQTIVLPTPGSWPDNGYGNRVLLDYDRMLAGSRGYWRHSVWSDFTPTAPLSFTLEDVPVIAGSATNGRFVVVPGTDGFGNMVGKVFAWGIDGSWSGGWVVRKNGFAIGGGCSVAAIDADDVIVCIATGAGGGPEVYRAERIGPSADWRIVAGGPVPGPQSGYSSRFKLALHDGKAYVGWPDTGPGIAGDDVGRVVVMGFDESIFRHGFE